MKIFVTGVGGQLGHDVMNELAKRGYETIGVRCVGGHADAGDGKRRWAVSRARCFCSRGWSGWTYMGRLGRACAAWTV